MSWVLGPDVVGKKTGKPISFAEIQQNEIKNKTLSIISMLLEKNHQDLWILL